MTYAKQIDFRFDGATFDQERDGERLSSQLLRVLETIKDGRWRSLKQLSNETGDPEASVSARLRDLRKQRFGGHVIGRRYLGGGLYEYRLET